MEIYVVAPVTGPSWTPHKHSAKKKLAGRLPVTVGVDAAWRMAMAARPMAVV